jgi:hypothetical protein
MISIDEAKKNQMMLFHICSFTIALVAITNAPTENNVKTSTSKFVNASI